MVNLQLPPEVKPGQSLPLLQALHILTRDGKLNQDSRRKLKQVYHLVNFIEPLMQVVMEKQPQPVLVDHGAGKSYLGFILYDLLLKQHAGRQTVLRRAAEERGLHLSDEVMAFMANRFSRDLSSLMHLLEHLDQYALRTQRAITIPLIKSMLENE